jgi:hypothetical protein
LVGAPKTQAVRIRHGNARNPGQRKVAEPSKRIGGTVDKVRIIYNPGCYGVIRRNGLAAAHRPAFELVAHPGRRFLGHEHPRKGQNLARLHSHGFRTTLDGNFHTTFIDAHQRRLGIDAIHAIPHEPHLPILMENRHSEVARRLLSLQNGGPGEQLDACIGEVAGKQPDGTVLSDPENNIGSKQHLGTTTPGGQFAAFPEILESAKSVRQRLFPDRDGTFEKIDQTRVSGDDRLSQPGNADRHGQAEKQEPEDEGMYHKSLSFVKNASDD